MTKLPAQWQQTQSDRVFAINEIAKALSSDPNSLLKFGFYSDSYCWMLGCGDKQIDSSEFIPDDFPTLESAVLHYLQWSASRISLNVSY